MLVVVMVAAVVAAPISSMIDSHRSYSVGGGCATSPATSRSTCASTTVASKIGARNDISYGVYIWAFPIQQLMALVLLETAHHILIGVFVLVVLALTLPFAWASWLLVEHPTIGLAKRKTHDRTPRVPAQA